MKVYVFDKILCIGELGVITDGKLNIDVQGLNEGEEITLHCSATGKYLVGKVKDGKVVFPSVEIPDGYVCRLQAKETAAATFKICDGKLIAVYSDIRAELDRVYMILSGLTGELRLTAEKISKFTDGFVTE